MLPTTSKTPRIPFELRNYFKLETGLIIHQTIPKFAVKIFYQISKLHNFIQLHACVKYISHLKKGSHSNCGVGWSLIP